METVLWVKSNPNEWENMTLGHFCSVQAPYQVSWGLKLAISWQQNDHWEKIAQMPQSSPRKLRLTICAPLEYTTLISSMFVHS